MQNLLDTGEVADEPLCQVPTFQLFLPRGLALGYALQEVVPVADGRERLGLHEVNAKQLRVAEPARPVMRVDWVHDLGVAGRNVVIEEDAVCGVVVPAEEERFSALGLQPLGEPGSVVVAQSDGASLATQLQDLGDDFMVSPKEGDVLEVFIEAGEICARPGLAGGAHDESDLLFGRVAKKGPARLRPVQVHPVVGASVGAVQHDISREERMPAFAEGVQLLLHELQVVAEGAEEQRERAALPLQLVQHVQEGRQYLHRVAFEPCSKSRRRAADLLR
mmetsp:Transcript_100912/g.301041  ORF Transcript_100912/g.301041 Transcript_100912/m.301041 type:complete len:277 (+) Transcript_100912:184-1014(+)